MSQAPAPLTLPQCKALCLKCIEALEGSKAEIELVLEEIAKLPAEQQAMAKMTRLMPLVSGKIDPIVTSAEFGLPNTMAAVMAVQSNPDKDDALNKAINVISASAMGNLPTDEEIKAIKLNL